MIFFRKKFSFPRTSIVPEVRKIQRSRGAFTLLEVIIAIALSSILLVSVCGIATNVIQLWLRSDNISSLERHVAGLNRFLNHLVDAQITTEITTTEDNATVVGSAWKQLPTSDDYFPSFTIKDSFPILNVGEIPTLETSAWRFWDSAGLWLITQTPRQLADSDSLCNFTLLSPLLSKAEFQIWDSSLVACDSVDSMEESDLESDGVRLILVFKKEKRSRELILTLSKTLPGGMNY